MLSNWKIVFVIVFAGWLSGASCVVLGASANAKPVGTAAKPARTAAKPARTAAKPARTAAQLAEQQEDDLRQVLMDLANAINSADSDKAAALWTEDAILINETGEITAGRDALKERLKHNIGSKQSSSHLELHPEKVVVAAPDVAVVVGSASRRDGSSDQPASRFSFVMVKRNNAWLIKEATETSIGSATNASDHLKELAWLIGNWQQTDKPGSPARLEVEWAGDSKNFIVSKTMKGSESIKQADRQIIGWDPRAQSVVSWHFAANGGFGYGKWSKQPKGWRVDFAGVGPDGANTTATNVFTIDNPEEFTWQSTEQIADGTPISDTEPVKLRRAKP